MAESLAIWTIILLALVSANLPFLVERQLLVLPWGGTTPANALLRVLLSLVFFAILAAFVYGVMWFVGGAFLVVSSGASVVLFLARVLAVVVLAALLLWLPARLGAALAGEKSFFVRMLELLVLYLMVGALAFAFETSLGNRFEQGWEFYAITLSLFLVMAYPSFVYRYLLQRRKASNPTTSR